MHCSSRRIACLLACALVLSVIGGCVEQTMEITTDPPGALVYLNDREVGRTPLKRDFVWYGDYDIEIRLEGYETLKTHKWIYAKAFNWVPFDLVSELQPFATLHDNKKLHFALAPKAVEKDEPDKMMSRAEELRAQLQSGEFTRKPMPTTFPTVGPTTRPVAPQPVTH